MCGEVFVEQFHKTTPEDVQNDITKRFMENTDLRVIITASAFSMGQLVVIFENYHKLDIICRLIFNYHCTFKLMVWFFIFGAKKKRYMYDLAVDK